MARATSPAATLELPSPSRAGAAGTGSRAATQRRGAAAGQGGGSPSVARPAASPRRPRRGSAAWRRACVARGLWFTDDRVAKGWLEAFVTDENGESIQVGHLSWTAELEQWKGEIESVFVDADWRRCGIATAMLAEARRLCKYPINHSPFRTTAGDAWAQSTGDHLPKLFDGD